MSRCGVLPVSESTGDQIGHVRKNAIITNTRCRKRMLNNTAMTRSFCHPKQQNSTARLTLWTQDAWLKTSYLSEVCQLTAHGKSLCPPKTISVPDRRHRCPNSCLHLPWPQMPKIVELSHAHHHVYTRPQAQTPKIVELSHAHHHVYTRPQAQMPKIVELSHAHHRDYTRPQAQTPKIVELSHAHHHDYTRPQVQTPKIVELSHAHHHVCTWPQVQTPKIVELSHTHHRVCTWPQVQKPKIVELSHTHHCICTWPQAQIPESAEVSDADYMGGRCITSECSKLASWSTRGDMIKLLELCTGASVTSTVYSVRRWARENVKILWLNIQTNHVIEHRRPDIVVVDKDNKRHS